MRPEIARRRIGQQESGRTPESTSNVLFTGVRVQLRRANLLGIGGIGSNPEVLRELRSSNAAEFPIKQRSNNLRGKVERVIDGVVRIAKSRRASRCLSQPEGHSAQECPSGPRHRNRGKVKLPETAPRQSKQEKQQKVIYMRKLAIDIPNSKKNSQRSKPLAA